MASFRRVVMVTEKICSRSFVGQTLPWHLLSPWCWARDGTSKDEQTVWAPRELTVYEGEQLKCPDSGKFHTDIKERE